MSKCDVNTTGFCETHKCEYYQCAEGHGGVSVSKITEEELEQILLKDKPFQHILKFAPASQRELMTFELAKYFQAYTAQQVSEARLSELESLKDWIDRIHYQPVVEGDRWVQAAGEIIDKLDDRIAQLEQGQSD